MASATNRPAPPLNFTALCVSRVEKWRGGLDDAARQIANRAVCHDILDFSARVLATLVHARPGLVDLSRGFSGSPVF